MNLQEAILDMFERPAHGTDPSLTARVTLGAYKAWLAVLNGDDPATWDVYVERHIAGWRFAIYDAQGREVDLSRVPYTEKEKKKK